MSGREVTDILFFPGRRFYGTSTGMMTPFKLTTACGVEAIEMSKHYGPPECTFKFPTCHWLGVLNNNEEQVMSKLHRPLDTPPSPRRALDLWAELHGERRFTNTGTAV